MPERTRLWICVTIVASVVAAAAAQVRPEAQETERGEQILNANCMECHDLRPVQVQALDKEGWTKMVNSMIEKGAEVKSDELPILVDYLVRDHGPLPDGP